MKRTLTMVGFLIARTAALALGCQKTRNHDDDDGDFHDQRGSSSTAPPAHDRNDDDHLDVDSPTPGARDRRAELLD